MMSFVQHTLLSVAQFAGLFDLVRRRTQHSLRVFTYHSVVEAPRARTDAPLLYRNAVPAGHFKRQMGHLKRHYRLLDGDALREALHQNQFPPDAALVTFDDGLVNNVTVALPILEELDVPALFFLPTGFVQAASEGTQRIHWTEDLIARLSTQQSPVSWAWINRHLPEFERSRSHPSPEQAPLAVVDHLKSLPQSVRKQRVHTLRDQLPRPTASAFPADEDGHSLLHTMTWEQARRASESLVTLGSHTVNHEILSTLSSKAAADEIRASKDHIEANTSATADFFSYPIGRPEDFSSSHQKMLSSSGYRAAFTQIPGVNTTDTDVLSLRRIDVSCIPSQPKFAYFESGAKYHLDRLIRPDKFSQT